MRCCSRRTSSSTVRQSTASQSKAASSGPFTTMPGMAASNLPIGSDSTFIACSQAHLTHVSALSGPGTSPYPASYPAATGGGAGRAATGFPVAFRRTGIRLLGHRSPAEDLGLPCGRLTDPYRVGPQRGCHVAHEQDTTGQDACFTPGTVVRTQPTVGLRPAPAASQRLVPTAPLLLPIGGGHFHEASTQVHAIRPSPRRPHRQPGPGSKLPAGLLLAGNPRMERRSLGLNPELRTPQLPATHVEAETGQSALARVLHPRHQPNLHGASHLNSCTFMPHPAVGGL
jgi:hypothetical protein